MAKQESLDLRRPHWTTSVTAPRFSRRSLIGLGASTLGLIAWLKLTARPAEALLPGDDPDGDGIGALVLTCMDYRFVGGIVRYLQQRGFTDDYDHVALAGAALGALNPLAPEWQSTWWTHLDLAIQLHNIRRVIVIDHLDCGAYKLILNRDFPDLLEEIDVHAHQMNELRRAIWERYPDLKVDLHIIRLDGSVALVP